MPSFFDLQKFAHTGIASPDMTAYDKMRALAAFGGGKVQTLTGVPPLSFKADGKPLISWSMLGNGQQTGTPTPDAPIMPEFCGKLVSSDWTIPITCGRQTTPVYLGQVSTVRKIRKLVLTGDETITMGPGNAKWIISIPDMRIPNITQVLWMCSHYQSVANSASWARYDYMISWSASDTGSARGLRIRDINYMTGVTVADFKAYLAQQYAAGTPVTVWYVLAKPTTGIINEPLAKIGDYCDELHSTDAGVSIPTIRGSNTLTVETELQPSSMTIAYRG